MNANETVKFDDLIRTGRDVDALRYFAKEYYDNGKMGHTRKMLVEKAADLIESLQAVGSANYWKSAWETKCAENKKLYEALAKSRRRADAAVECLNATEPCDYCKHYDENNICARPLDYGYCFEWRGPQDEKGAEK